MRVAIDISQIIFSGGVGKYTRSLVKNLLKIDHKNKYLLLGYSLRQGDVFSEFASSLKKEKLNNFELKKYPLPTSFLEPLVNSWRLPKLQALVGQVDIYHSSDWLQFRSKAKIVTTLHDLAPIILPQYHHKKIIKVFKRRLKLLKDCKAIIAVSKNTKNDFLDHYDYLDSKIHVVYEAPVIKPKNKKVLSKTKQKYVLTVSSLNPRKNIKRLLQAFAIFKQQHPEYKLVVIGAFGWGEKYQNNVDVKFLSKVGKKELIDWYQGAELFLYPSLYEGFGLPVLEAMSFALPVVTSKTSSLAEIAGDAAVLVDPKKVRDIAVGMEEALENKRKFTRLGRERVKKFSWKKCAKETLAVYEKVFQS